MAETRVQLSTADRLVSYTPVIPPSFLAAVCTAVEESPEVVLDTVEVETKVDGISTVACPWVRRYMETHVPTADGSPLQWLPIPSSPHYQRVNNGVSTPDNEILVASAIGLIDRLVFPVPSRPVDVLERIVSTVRCIGPAGGTPLEQKLYVNGGFVASVIETCLGVIGNVAYDFSTLGIDGPITSIEIEIISGAPTGSQVVLELEAGYTYI